MTKKKDLTPEQEFAQNFVTTFSPKTFGDVVEGLTSIFGLIFETMLQGEMDYSLSQIKSILIPIGFCYTIYVPYCAIFL